MNMGIEKLVGTSRKQDPLIINYSQMAGQKEKEYIVFRDDGGRISLVGEITRRETVSACSRLKPRASSLTYERVHVRPVDNGQFGRKEEEFIFYKPCRYMPRGIGAKIHLAGMSVPRDDPFLWSEIRDATPKELVQGHV
jgi:hypothetical protein